MKNSFIIIKWILQKYISKLTLYRLLIITIISWLLGCWIWIIPVYLKKISILKKENYDIYQLINNQDIQSTTRQVENLPPLSYTHLLIITRQHQLNLEEFRLVESEETQYQIIVKGSWLNVRKFLSELIEGYMSNLTIKSFDFQRDKSTNEVSLTIMVTLGGEE